MNTYCLGVFSACVLYFCIYTSSAHLSMFHMERCSRNILIIIVVVIVVAVVVIIITIIIIIIIIITIIIIIIIINICCCCCCCYYYFLLLNYYYARVCFQHGLIQLPDRDHDLWIQPVEQRHVQRAKRSTRHTMSGHPHIIYKRAVTDRRCATQGQRTP